MINKIQENWHVVVDAFFNHPLALLISIIGVVVCVALAFLTIYAAAKFEVLRYFFFALIVCSLANFYIDLLISGIKLFK